MQQRKLYQVPVRYQKIVEVFEVVEVPAFSLSQAVGYVTHDEKSKYNPLANIADSNEELVVGSVRVLPTDLAHLYPVPGKPMLASVSSDDEKKGSHAS